MIAFSFKDSAMVKASNVIAVHTPLAFGQFLYSPSALQEIGVPADTPSTVPSSAILAVKDEIKSLITS